MARYYLDSSSLVKLYVREPGTDGMLRLVGNTTAEQCASVSLTKIEVHSALRRRQRAGTISAAAAAHIIDLFERDLKSNYVLESVTDTLAETACVVIERNRLRAMDAIHLATCIKIAETTATKPTFVSADQQLLRAAQAEGIPTLDVSHDFGI